MDYTKYIGQDGGVKLNPDSSHLFSCLTKATYIDSINLNTDNVVNMNSMFYYCYSLAELEVGHFNISNVVDISNMFAGEASNTMKLKTVDVSNWDVSNVKIMNATFGMSTNGGENSFEVLDVSNWNTPNAISMHKMFQGCNNLQSLDVSNFDTSNVTSIGRMFQDCFKLANIDVSNFNTSKVTNMELMFGALAPYSYNMNFQLIDVSHFDTSNVSDMENMFAGCSLILF